jgi:signal recognition particle subunit SRP54
MRKGKFTIDEFRDQLKQIRRMGTMTQIGLGGPLRAVAEQEIDRIEAMISSMTPDERRNPDKIDLSRRNRVANGSGTQPSDVHQLIMQFQGMASMMQKLSQIRLKAPPLE